MATKPGDINANVGIALDAQGMSGNLKALQESIGSIVTMLNKAGQSAEQAIKTSGRAGAESVKEIRGYLQQIQQAQKAVSTLGTLNTKNLFGSFSDANNIGKTAAGIDKFFRGLESGSPTIEKLTSRLTLMNQQAAQMLQSGQTVPRNFWDKRLNVQNATDAFKKIDTSYQRMLDRFNGLSSSGQAKLTPNITALQNAMQEFDRLAANPRSSAALTAKATALRQMTTELEKQIGLIAQQDRGEQSLLNATRRRAEAMLSASSAEREAALRSDANRYSTILAGRTGGGQFNDVIGDPVARLKNQVNGTEALNKATRLLATTQVQLNTAMSSNAPAQRIQDLINRYEKLKDLQALSLAQANKQTAPGFFGGILQGVQTVARGPGGEGQGLAGVGNLIGRVGAFTAAYQAINLVTSGLKDGISFIIQWQDQLAQLQAISGATGIEMQNLSNSILEVSKNSANSVAEITESAKILAQAGYSAQETGTLLQNVVDLSAASGASPADSVDILTSAMGAFNLQVSDAGHVTDALVTTLNATKLSANQVQLGLQYLGATAKENNLTFEDLVATLGAAADAGIRSGSTMATGTRQLLIDLQDPTKKLVEELQRIGLTMGDVDVKTKGFIPVLETLRDHGFNAFQAIETRAAAMYEVLSDNVDEMEALRAQTLQTNTAHEAAAKRLESVNAQWTIMKNGLAAVANDAGKTLLPILMSIIGVLNRLGEAISPIIQHLQDLRNGLNSFSTGGHELLMSGINEFLGIFGGHIDTASTNTSDLADSMDQAQTNLDDATAAMRNQQQQIKSLEDETSSLITRHDTLAKSNQSVQYETDRLAGRFPGLREEFSKTKGGIDGLIQAMEALDAQSRNTLANVTQQQAQIAQQTFNIANTSAVNILQGLLAKYNTGDSRTRAIQLLGTPTTDPNYLVKRDQGQVIANNYISAFGDAAKEFKEDVGKLTSAIQQAQSTRNVMNNSYISLATSAFSRTAQGRSFGNAALEDNAKATALESQLQGLPLDTRRTRITGLVNQIEAHVLQLTKAIEELSKAGNTAAVTAATRLKSNEENTVRRLKSLANPTDEETRDANRRPHGPGAGRTMTSDDMAAALRKAFPGIGISSTYRGPNTDLGRRFPNSWHTNSPGGHALDITHLPAGVTTDNIKAFMESLGQQIGPGNNGFMDEFKHPIPGHTTGGNYHFGWMAKQSRDSQEQQRAQDKEENEALKRQLALKNEHVKALREGVQTQEDVLANEHDITKLGEDYNALQQKSSDYVKAQLDAATAEANRRGLTGQDRIDFLNDAKEKALQDARQLYLKALDDMGKAIATYIQDVLKAIQDRMDRNLAAAKNNLAVQQGKLTGLNNPLVAGTIPDYTKVLQQRRVDTAQQSLNVGQYQENIRAISDLETHLKVVSDEYERIKATDPEGASKVWQVYNNDVLTAQGRIRDLREAVTEFASEQQALALAPKSWGDALNQAIQAWQQANNAGMGLDQRMWMGLGDAIESIHGTFTTFFTDIMSGTVSVGKAFGNMAKGIMQALEEMAAKAIATQIFSLLLSFIPGAAGVNLGSFTNPGLVPTGFGGSVSPLVYRGGLIESFGRSAKRYATGGMVGAGIPTRDSVPSMLSKGEFVMRRTAAESIGHSLLMDMNNRGAAALNKLDKSGVVVNNNPQETNVWVVLPEEKPVPGPNDILAVVHGDVLRNGATKSLIQRVARGG